MPWRTFGRGRFTGHCNRYFSDRGRHLYEQAEEVRYRSEGGLALEPEVVRGWKTYNFEVEDYHTYIAGGVRVHNDSYIIKPGDTLSALAQKYGTSVDAIVKLNPGIIDDGRTFGAPERELREIRG